MSNDKPGALPNYFDMLQGFMNSFGHAAPAGAAPVFPVLDPKEIERKISELETVLVWLKAQAGVVELSVETMKVQLNWLKEMQAGNDSAKAKDPEELAKMAGAMNPALWAWNVLQQSAAAAAAPPASTPKAATKKSRR
jgi:peptidoglycan hydrolase CwlO-like protein